MTEWVPRMWESSAEAKKVLGKPGQAGHSPKCLNQSVLPLYWIGGPALCWVLGWQRARHSLVFFWLTVHSWESEGILILALTELTLPCVPAVPKVCSASLGLAVIHFSVLCAWWACQTVDWYSSSLQNVSKFFPVIFSPLFSLFFQFLEMSCRFFYSFQALRITFKCNPLQQTSNW